MKKLIIVIGLLITASANANIHKAINRCERSGGQKCIFNILHKLASEKKPNKQYDFAINNIEYSKYTNYSYKQYELFGELTGPEARTGLRVDFLFNGNSIYSTYTNSRNSRGKDRIMYTIELGFRSGHSPHHLNGKYDVRVYNNFNEYKDFPVGSSWD